MSGPLPRTLVNPCEWNPEMNRPAQTHDAPHAEATVCVGTDGAWHLCDSCAALPAFKRFRVRRPLKSSPPSKPPGSG